MIVLIWRNHVIFRDRVDVLIGRGARGREEAAGALAIGARRGAAAAAIPNARPPLIREPPPAQPKKS